MNWALLQNSLLLAGLTTLLSVGFGFLAALWLTGRASCWRNRVLAVAIMAVVLPPFLVTNCWLDLLGLTGKWRSWLPVNIYSLGGAVWVLTLLTWPITLLLVWSAWRRLEAAQLESDPALGGGALIRWLLWPMARVAVGQAAVLTFVLALNNFTVPAILQVKVFPAEVWIQFNTHLKPVRALAAAWPLVVAPVLLLIVLRQAEMSWPREQGPLAASAFRRQLGRGWSGFSAMVTGVVLLLSVGLPLAEVVSSARTWSELPNLLRAVPGVIWNSFAFAAVTASLCMAVGLATWRLRAGLVLWLPFLVPGVMVGLAMIWIFNHPALGLFYGSAAAVIVAFTVRYLAPGWNVVAHALRGVDRDLTDAARLDGAAGWSLLRHVHWPQIAPQVGAAWYVTYLLCLWDVETLVLICPPGGETLALRVFNLLHYGHSAQVNALCLLLLALALAPLLAWSVVQRLADRR
jgi:ABC-type Fe3+ transport system permease subunit